MQGLMIESHIDPSVAWTDAKQQVTPSALEELVSRLNVRDPESSNEDFTDNLATLRKQIDKIDEVMIQKLGERMAIVKKIGEFKRDNKVTILQVNRWDEILKKGSAFARALKLDLAFTEKFLESVHGESIRIQTEIMNEGKTDAEMAEATEAK